MLLYPAVELSGMKKILIAVSALVLMLVFSLGAGCSQPTQQTTTPPPTTEATAMPTTAATPEATTVAAVSTPGPVETLPSIWGMQVQVGSNGEAIDPQVIFTFRGGKGQNLIPEIDVRVTRFDGVVEDAKFATPFYVGETVSLPMTPENNGVWSNKDRAQVWAITPQGQRVLLVDQYVPFAQYH